jgi:hypothetical protein
MLSSTSPVSLNPNAIGVIYRLHGPQVDDCGSQSNSFKGAVDESGGPYTVPGDVQGTNGVHAGPTRTLISNQPGCDGDTLDNCKIVVVLCDHADGKNLLYCDAFATFQITDEGSNTDDGMLLGGSLVTSGYAGNGVPVFGQNRVVRLIQ